MNKFEAYTIAVVVGLSELVALALFGASFAVWCLVFSGRI
jgi:hypothetical protein